MPNKEATGRFMLFKYKRDRLLFAFRSAVPLKPCPTTETMKLLQVQDKFGLRGAPGSVTEKRSWHRSSHVVTVLWHWAGHLSLREAAFACCWFCVAVGFGGESRDHSMNLRFLQEESIWGIKESKNLNNLSSVTLPCFMELSLQKTSSKFYLLLRVFTKTAQDQTQENSC